GVLVLVEDLGDPVEERPELGLGPGLFGAEAGRLAVPEDLLQRLPVDAGLAEDLALAGAVDQDAASDLSPLQHVPEHPWASGRVVVGRGHAGPRSTPPSQRPRWGAALSPRRPAHFSIALPTAAGCRPSAPG